MSNTEQVPEGYIKIERIDPVQGQTFEVVLLDGRVFPQNENEFLTGISNDGKVGGYCSDLEGFQCYYLGQNLVVVKGHMYKLAEYYKPVTGEVIPKESISHFRHKQKKS